MGKRSVLAVFLLFATAAECIPPPECPKKCGKIDIPYPFGIGENCSFRGSDNFTLVCKDRHNNTPRPFRGNYEITGVVLEKGELNVSYRHIPYICYSSSNTTSHQSDVSFNLSGSPFLVSATANKFTAVGCYTVAIIGGRENLTYFTGCIAYCSGIQEAAPDGSPCTGLGCCQADLTPGLSYLDVTWNSNNTNSAWKYSPCSYAFIANKDWYSFRRADLVLGENDFVNQSIPLVLDWAIRINGSSCPLQSGKTANPVVPYGACVSDHSYCVNVTGRDEAGYLCNCSDGYQGNPYLKGPGGCTNINECDLRRIDPAKYEKIYPCYSGSRCHDTEGDYKCKCRFLRTGDGKVDNGCRPIIPGYAVTAVVTIVAGVVVAILTLYIMREHRRRKQKELYDKNGGNILNMILDIEFFTEEELKEMTANYSVDRKLGNGCFGEVYMGITKDNKEVAVKRYTRKGGGHDKQDFADEISSQARIQHVNLVRLVGCCLQTEVPMLVLEFVPGGSLHDVLHGNGRHTHLPLPTRLDITVGSAEALAYMHSNIGHKSIVHGDIKSGNILLSNNLEPKVSDFGSSKLTSVAKSGDWSVMGDYSYIDPAYIKTGDFTEKSDVYSFGVVLLELITRKTALYEDRKSLPLSFAKYYRDEGARRNMYDHDMLSSTDAALLPCYIECLDRMANLAIRCLKEDVDERPTMADALEELKVLRASLRVNSDDGPTHEVEIN